MSNPGWLLIAPAENWQHPRPVKEADLGLLLDVANSLGLRMTRDDGKRKVYLDLPGPHVAAQSSQASPGVLYPSGKTIPKASLSEAEAARYGTTGEYAAAPLLAARVDDSLSEHFQAGEFMPHDSSYRYLRVSPHLVEALEQVRAALGGRPVTILSAYRPPAYNRLAGGVSDSCHIDGLAADIFVEGVTTAELLQVCEKVIGNGGGVGYYPVKQFCHVDVGGYYRRWDG